ncbi:lanC-like protein 3 [Neodiprion virginianus]|uniref:LanC-like protein 3 n=1 Tax=Neodiprion lecontei TaxID=441921 RepID=A0A6J0BPK5_NEOLC|nr:lanC-like protein 3 [Neodiprion lecontei]XP_046605195.1 lanC-like protein 3 [Neodiprion virginianus]
MSRPLRYIVNELEDYKDQDVAKEVIGQKKELMEIVREIAAKQPASESSADGGLYVGIAGIAYMGYHLSQISQLQEERSNFVLFGLQYLAPALEHADRCKDSKKEKSSFLLGNAGIYAVAAVLHKAAKDSVKASDYAKRYLQGANNCKPINFLSCGGDELFVGRTGYLFGALWLNKHMDSQVVPLKEIHEIAQAIVQSGRQHATDHGSPCPLMYSYYETEYLGAAHGLSSILQVLIQTPKFLESDPVAEKLVQASVDYLLGLQTKSGNFPCAMDELDRRSRSEIDELVHWCHGAPGVVYLMAAAYLHWKDERYLESCLKCGELTWRKGLLKKGPGICHGIAGSGYVFLLLYRLTQDPKHWHRAAAFANFLKSDEFYQNARRPDSPYSLYEGFAGTACFLADLLEPEKANFPFQDVF